MSTPNFSEVTRSLKRCYARFKFVQDVQERLDLLLDEACDYAEPDVLFIVGETGMGKSTLLRQYALKHPRVDHETVTEIPVVYAEVPAKCTHAQLPAILLKAMGSPMWNRGDVLERTEQLITLLRACKTRLILLDEVNHFIDRGRERSHYLLADSIKQLIDVSRIPFALAGIPRARTLLKVNEQLAARICEVYEIQPFGAGATCKNQIAVALKAFDGLLQDVERINLTDEQAAKSFAFATAGRLRNLRQLLVKAVQIASKLDRPRIDYAVLAEAFRTTVFPRAPDTRNPFVLKVFDGIPLTRPDEPFAPRRQPKEEVDV